MPPLAPLPKVKGLTDPFKAATKDPLAALTTGNAAARATLASQGVPDPAKDPGPSFLERILGPLDAPGAGIRSLVHNAFAAPKAEVSPWGEMGKAVQGLPRIEGSKIVEDIWGRKVNPWAKMLGGIAVDVILDPITWVTVGYGGLTKDAAKAGLAGLSEGGLTAEKLTGIGMDMGEVASKYGDDVARALSEGAVQAVDLPVGLSRDIASAMRASTAAGLGTRGGVKFMGVQLTPAPTVEKAGYAAKDVLRSLPGSELLEQSFLHGGMPAEAKGIYRAGNEVVNAALDMAMRDVSRRTHFAEVLGAEFNDRIKELVPDAAQRDAITYAIGRQFGDEQSLAKIAAAWADAADLPAVEQAKALQDALFDPDAIARILSEKGLKDKELADAIAAAHGVQAHFQDILERSREAGIDLKELFPGMGSKGFLPGMTPLDAEVPEKAYPLREMVGRLAPETPKSKVFTTPEMRLKGISEFDLAKAGRAGTPIVPSVEGGIPTITDIAELAGRYTAKREKEIGFAVFQKDLTDILGNDEAAKALVSKSRELFTNDAATQGWLKLTDKAMNTWRKAATIWNIPMFPARNKLSNLWLMSSEGMLNPEAWGKSPALLMGKGTIRIAGKTYTGQEISQLAREYRVVVGEPEFANLVGEQAATSQFVLTKAGRYINQNLVEDADRLATFIAAMRKGAKPEAAALVVDRTLYNYAPEALTVFERNFMRRLMPFYSWARRNTPHMVELFATKPGLITSLGHAREVGKDVTGYDTAIEPDYLRQLMVVPTPLTDSAGNTVAWNPNLPPQDLTKLDLQLRDTFGSVSPIIKMPLELFVFKKDVYLNKNLEPGVRSRAPGSLQAINKALGPNPAWETVKRFLGMATYIDPTTQDSYLAIDERAAKAMRDIAPVFNSLNKVVDSSPRTPWDRFAQGTGIKLIPFDKAKMTLQRAYADQDALGLAIKALQKQGIATTKKGQPGSLLNPLVSPFGPKGDPPARRLHGTGAAQMPGRRKHESGRVYQGSPSQYTLGGGGGSSGGGGLATPSDRRFVGPMSPAQTRQALGLSLAVPEVQGPPYDPAGWHLEELAKAAEEAARSYDAVLAAALQTGDFRELEHFKILSQRADQAYSLASKADMARMRAGITASEAAGRAAVAQLSTLNPKAEWGPWQNSPASYFGGPSELQPTAYGRGTEDLNANGPYYVASRDLPGDTEVQVRYGPKTVTAYVKDYGPAKWTGRNIDLGYNTAQALGYTQAGNAPVSYRVMGGGPQAYATGGTPYTASDGGSSGTSLPSGTQSGSDGLTAPQTANAQPTAFDTFANFLGGSPLVDATDYVPPIGTVDFSTLAPTEPVPQDWYTQNFASVGDPQSAADPRSYGAKGPTGISKVPPDPKTMGTIPYLWWAIGQMNKDMSAAGKGTVAVNSGWRSIEEQAALHEKQPKTSSPPGLSTHGIVVDGKPASPSADLTGSKRQLAEVRKRAGRYSLEVVAPKSEPWHVAIKPEMWRQVT